MQIDVVVSQALLGGQTRAETLVRGLGDAGLIEAERREQLAQALDLILVRARDMLEPPARTRFERAPRPGLRASPRLRTPDAG